MLKYTADIKSIFYMILTTWLLFFLWQNGFELGWPMFILFYVVQLHFAVAASVMSHNHQHLPMWKSKFMNRLTNLWLSMFYGFPIFAWIPTHNRNHHVHINTDEDYTRTYRLTEKTNLLTLLSYPSISGYFQQKPVFNYFTSLWSTDKSKFFGAVSEILAIVAFVGIGLFLDWRKALVFIVIPQQISLYFVLLFNYVQHVHADEETKYNNSRNFTGWMLNAMLFNNGFHTVHHISGKTHWSELKTKHEALIDKIHPSLNENSFYWFLFRVYILGAFSDKYKSKSMREARLKGEPVVTPESAKRVVA